MARTLSSTLSTAIAQVSTKPIFLLRLTFSGETRVACWGADITWNGESWVSSGAEVQSIDDQRARIQLPGSDDFVALCLTNAVRGGAVKIYQYYEDTTASPNADAVLIFDGIMDGVTLDDNILLNCVASLEVKQFPPTRIDQPTFTYLPVSGTKITWGNDTVLVN